VESAIVIPARYASTRFPGKPLAFINGQSLIHRMWCIAMAVPSVDQVYVATDHEDIARHVEGFGGQVIMTAETCENGTERVYDAIRKIKKTPDIIINLQGDAVLTPPFVIDALASAMQENTNINFATLATVLNSQQHAQMQMQLNQGVVGGTTVVVDQNNDALYFSRYILPFIKEKNVAVPSVFYRHIGLYGYRFDTLNTYVYLKPSPLEQVEGLEQLRALENGIKIKVVLVDYQGRSDWAIDTPEDVDIVENIIYREGEIISE
jgi:3-deoxy-manno-octulosonate cytidylyltransferase (CMP-KDO synthetase)